MKNMKEVTVPRLVTRLAYLELAARAARGRQADQLAREWSAIRDELDSRPTEEVLAALG